MKLSPESICTAWKEFTDATLKPEVFHANLEKLSEWSNSKSKTIRHMSAEQLANLRQETIHAVTAQGSTKERAEELTAHITVSAESFATGESALPHLDRNGVL